jgi:hypothetical protein
MYVNQHTHTWRAIDELMCVRFVVCGLCVCMCACVCVCVFVCVCVHRGETFGARGAIGEVIGFSQPFILQIPSPCVLNLLHTHTNTHTCIILQIPSPCILDLGERERMGWEGGRGIQSVCGRAYTLLGLKHVSLSPPLSLSV